MKFPFLQLPFLLGADEVPPTISSPSPAAASTLSGATAAVSFHLTDLDGGVVSLLVKAAFDDRPAEIICYGDPSGALTFAYGYSGSATPITNGYSISIVPTDPGWGDNPVLSAQAEDAFGNRLEMDDETIAYTYNAVPPGDPDETGPTIEDIAPTPDTAIDPDQAITFKTLDERALRRVFVCAKFTLLGSWEVIHDGFSFGPKYSAGSTRQAISGGYSWSVERAGGWPEAPTLSIDPIDTGGNSNA